MAAQMRMELYFSSQEAPRELRAMGTEAPSTTPGHLPAGQPIEGLAQQIAGGDGGDEKDVRVPRHRLQ